MQHFFVSGYNKSGTTFLQMLLNAHPAIHCPSEQHFKTLWQGLESLSKNYKSALEFFDERTARQGINFDQTAFSEHLVKHALLELAQFGTDEHTTHCGLNDNSLIGKADIYARLLPEARFVFIIRDPRDIGASLWHHRMRVEPGFADKNKPIDDMILGVCRAWPTHLSQILDFQANTPGRVHILRYEDLISPARTDTLSHALDFLGVTYDEAVTAAMFAATDFDTLKKKERKKNGDTGFFRSGKKDGWRDILSDEQKTKALDSSRAMLEKFNYSL